MVTKIKIFVAQKLNLVLINVIKKLERTGNEMYSIPYYEKLLREVFL